MITGYGGPPHGCLRAFGKTGQENLTGRRKVYATSTDNANTRTSPVIPLRWPRRAALAPEGGAGPGATPGTPARAR